MGWAGPRLRGAEPECGGQLTKADGITALGKSCWVGRENPVILSVVCGISKVEGNVKGKEKIGSQEKQMPIF